MATKSDAKKATATKKTTVKKEVSKASVKNECHKTYERFMGTCRFVIILGAFFLVSSVFFMVGFGFREETDNYVRPITVIENTKDTTNEE